MNNYSPSRAKFMYRVSLRVLFTTIVLLPGLARAQRSPGVLRDIGVRNAPDIGNRISTGSRQPLGRSGLSVVFAPTLRQPVESDNPVPLVVTSQFGIHSVSQSPRDRTTTGYHWAVSSLQLGESSKVDTSSHHRNRTTHIVIGVVAGVVGGVLLGKSVDKGRAGCGEERSGATCDWGSGLYEPLFGVIGGAIGGVVGALVPHS
jgi:hypothetical protein